MSNMCNKNCKDCNKLHYNEYIKRYYCTAKKLTIEKDTMNENGNKCGSCRHFDNCKTFTFNLSTETCACWAYKKEKENGEQQSEMPEMIEECDKWPTITHPLPMDEHIFNSIREAKKEAIEDFEKEMNGK